jgi:hypothetical protein
MIAGLLLACITSSSRSPASLALTAGTFRSAAITAGTFFGAEELLVSANQHVIQQTPIHGNKPLCAQPLPPT